MSVLVPTSITIESSGKFFGLEKGVSTGTLIATTFDVPEGTTADELKVARLEEKERLDLLVLTMEVARGSMTVEEYKGRRSVVQENYAKIRTKYEASNEQT